MAAFHVRRERRWSILVLTILIAALTSCQPRRCARFYGELSHSDQRAEFLSYSPEKQVDVYLCGMTREPADYSACQYLKEEGDLIVPALLDRLSREKNKQMQSSIVSALLVISLNGTLEGRQDVTDRVAASVHKMKDPGWRAIAESGLGHIEDKTHIPQRRSYH